MTRDDWCDQFIDELIKLRPHATHRFAKTLALHQYDPKEHQRDKARQYNKAQALPAKIQAVGLMARRLSCAGCAPTCRGSNDIAVPEQTS